jgi:plastocyanin
MLNRIGPLAAALVANAAWIFDAAKAAELDEERIDVRVSSFRFNPAEIQLHHGHRYVRHFTNESAGSHVRGQAILSGGDDGFRDPGLLSNGSVELRGRKDATLVVVAPAPGEYEFHCSHFLHRSLGMSGKIVVS